MGGGRCKTKSTAGFTVVIELFIFLNQSPESFKRLFLRLFPILITTIPPLGTALIGLAHFTHRNRLD